MQNRFYSEIYQSKLAYPLIRFCVKRNAIGRNALNTHLLSQIYILSYGNGKYKNKPVILSCLLYFL